MTPLTTIGNVRDAISSFVRARDWSKFHTPRNVALALSGEVGEISEIFQWKGSLEEGLDGSFSMRDREHIGEELADVFIYTTRLSDLSGINLASAVYRAAKNGGDDSDQMRFELIQNVRCPPGAIWVEDMNFDELCKLEQASRDKRQLGKIFLTKNPRDVLFHLHIQLGKISSSLYPHEEAACTLGLDTWTSEELLTLVEGLVGVILDLIWIADLCDLSLPKVLADKMKKNGAKYPANRCRGKSAKYTSYLTSNSNVSMSTALGSGAALLAFGVGLGYCLNIYTKSR